MLNISMAGGNFGVATTLSIYSKMVKMSTRRWNSCKEHCARPQHGEGRHAAEMGGLTLQNSRPG